MMFQLEESKGREGMKGEITHNSLNYILLAHMFGVVFHALDPHL